MVLNFYFVLIIAVIDLIHEIMFYVIAYRRIFQSRIFADYKLLIYVSNNRTLGKMSIERRWVIEYLQRMAVFSWDKSYAEETL